MALIDELETLARLMRQLPEVEKDAERCQEAAKNALDNVAYVKEGIEEIRQRVCDLLMPPNIVVDGPQAPSQLLPSVEVRFVTPATEESSGGTISLFRDEFTGHSVDEEGQDVEALRDRIVGDEWEQQQAVASFAAHDAPSVEIPEGFTKWEGGEWTGDDDTKVDVILASGASGFHQQNRQAWSLNWAHDGSCDAIIAYRIIEEAGGYAPVTDEPASVLDSPELQETVARLTAKLEEAEQPRGLIDPELDADLERVREQERAEKPEQPKRHAFWPFVGKLEDA